MFTRLEEENILNITNYRQMIEICKQFKRKVLTARTDANRSPPAPACAPTAATPAAPPRWPIRA